MDAKVTITMVSGRTQAISIQQPSTSLKEPVGGGEILGLVDEGGAAREEFELQWGKPKTTTLRMSNPKFRILIVKRKDGRDIIFGEVTIVTKKGLLDFEREQSYDIMNMGEKVGYVVFFFSKKGQSMTHIDYTPKVEKDKKKKDKEKKEKKDKKKSRDVSPANSPRRDGSAATVEHKNTRENLEAAQSQLKKALDNRKYKSLTSKVQQRLKESSSCGGVEKLDLSELGLNLLPSKHDYPSPLPSTVHTIDASFNQIFLFPDLSCFSNLTNLELNGNKMPEVSATIGLCVNLVELSIIGSEVETVSKAIRKCTKLEKINMSNNKLSELDLSGLSKMDDLVVCGNQLKAIPWGMKTMPLLTSFDISDNQLSHLSSDVISCNRLIEFKISNNNLTSLPPDFGKLSRVEHLLLADNKLKDLPMSIGRLPLSFIDISRNPIQDPKIFEKWKLGTDHLANYLELRMDLNKSDQKRKKEKERAERSKTPNAKRPTDRSPARSRPSPAADSPQRSRSPPRVPPRSDNRSPPRAPLTARSPSPAPSSSLAPASARSRSKTASGSNSPVLAVPGGEQKARGSAVGKKSSKSRLPPSSDAKGAGGAPATAGGIKLNLYGNNSFSGVPGESALPSGTGSNLAVGRGVGGGGSFCASPRRKPPVDAGAGGASNRYQPSSLGQQQQSLSLAPPTQQQPQQQQQQQPPQQDKIVQIKKVVGLCRENILSSKSIIQAIHDKLVRSTTIQQLTQIAASLKPTRETYKDIKLITPEQMLGTQTPTIPKTPYGDQFNNLLKTLIVLCCEMINVLIGLMGFISSVTRDYLGGGSSSALRQVAQAGKLTRDFAQQLQGAQP